MTSLSFLYVLIVVVGILISTGLLLSGQVAPIIGYWAVVVWFILAAYVIFFRKTEIDTLVSQVQADRTVN
jgi:lipopolysaccharide export LptBFGC system permease protein LptF